MGGGGGRHTIVDVLDGHAERCPERTAYSFVRDGTRVSASVTFGGLALGARRVAASLTGRGIEPGERALLLHAPDLEFILAFLGCLYAGVVPVPLHPPRPNRPPTSLWAVGEDSGARAVLTTRDRLAELASHVAALPGRPRLLATDGDDDLPAAGDPWSRPGLAADAVAFLQYTSGSTGTPKGVAITHANLMANQAAITRAFGHGPETRVVGWLPLYHDMGLIGNVLNPLYLGAPCWLMSPFEFVQRPVRWLRAVSTFGATTSGGPDFGYRLCVERIGEEQRAGLDLGCWRVAFNGSERVQPATIDAFSTAFAGCGFRRRAFFPCYGMAEVTLFVSGTDPGEPPLIAGFDATALARGEVVERPADAPGARRLVGCGPTGEGLAALIVDPETRLPRPPGRIGEIWLTGTSIARGYHRRPPAGGEDPFAARLAGGGGVEGGRYFRTGDLGFRHRGQLFITGRIKDLIIIDGRNHAPQDIEATVEACHEAVRTAGVAAVAVEVDGREALGLVVEVDHRRARDDRELEAVLRAVRTAVAQEHAVRPEAVALVNAGAVPRTTSGKIKRAECARMLDAGVLPWRARYGAVPLPLALDAGPDAPAHSPPA